MKKQTKQHDYIKVQFLDHTFSLTLMITFMFSFFNERFKNLCRSFNLSRFNLIKWDNIIRLKVIGQEEKIRQAQKSKSCLSGVATCGWIERRKERGTHL